MLEQKVESSFQLVMREWGINGSKFRYQGWHWASDGDMRMWSRRRSWWADGGLWHLRDLATHMLPWNRGFTSTTVSLLKLLGCDGKSIKETETTVISACLRAMMDNSLFFLLGKQQQICLSNWHVKIYGMQQNICRFLLCFFWNQKICFNCQLPSVEDSLNVQFVWRFLVSNQNHNSMH